MTRRVFDFVLGSALSVASATAQVHTGSVSVDRPVPEATTQKRGGLDCTDELNAEDKRQVEAFKTHLENISGIQDPATLQRQITSFLKDSQMSKGAKMAAYALLEQRKDEALRLALSRNAPFAKAYENWGSALTKLNQSKTPSSDRQALVDAAEYLQSRIRVTRFDAAYPKINRLIQSNLQARVELASKVTLQQADQKTARAEIPKILGEFAVTSVATAALAATGMELGAVVTGAATLSKVRKAWMLTGAFVAGGAGYVGTSDLVSANRMARSNSITLRTDFACELASAYQQTHVLDDMLATAVVAGGVALAVNALPATAGTALVAAGTATFGTQSAKELVRQQGIAASTAGATDPEGVRAHNRALSDGGKAAASVGAASVGLKQIMKSSGAAAGAAEASAVRRVSPRPAALASTPGEAPLKFEAGERVRFRGDDGIIRGAYYRGTQGGWTRLVGRQGNTATIRAENVFRMTGMSKIPRTPRNSIALKGESITYLNKVARITSQGDFAQMPRLEQVKLLSDALPAKGDASLLSAALWESGVPGVRLVKATAGGKTHSWIEVEVPAAKSLGERYVIDGKTVKPLKAAYQAAQSNPKSIDATFYTQSGRTFSDAR